MKVIYEGSAFGGSSPALKNVALPLLACLMVVAACKGGPAGAVHITNVRDLPVIQRLVPFEIVLPKYLPEGFNSLDMAEDPFNDEINQFVRVSYGHDDEIHLITIMEGVPLPRESYPLDSKWEYKYLKGVRVQVVYGGFLDRRLPDGSTVYLEGVQAEWNYHGVSFYLTTVGVLWDEAEKVVASMIQ